MSFELYSDDFMEGDRLPQTQVYNGNGHSGSNISPHLAWRGAPHKTKSFAVTLFDPDAVRPGGWWHWIVINIPATTTSILRGAGSNQAELPVGSVETLTDFGTPGYGGAAPPPGKVHRYIFTVHALKVPHLDLGRHDSPSTVDFQIQENSIGQASLTALYGV